MPRIKTTFLNPPFARCKYVTKYWHIGCKPKSCIWLPHCAFKGTGHDFFLIPSEQNVDVTVSSRRPWKQGCAEQKKEEIWVLNIVRLPQKAWTHVQNNTCIRNKLLSHWGIHCFESLLQQQNLCLSECKMVLSCNKAQWEKCPARSAMSIVGKGPDGSMPTLTSYCMAIQLTPKWKTFQGNSDVTHTLDLPFVICLPLCAIVDTQASSLCIWYKYKEMRLT